MPLEADEIFQIAVVVQSVNDLDTWQINIEYNPVQLLFIKWDSHIEDYQNFLSINGGKTLPMPSIEKEPGKITLANSLIGADSSVSPEGS